MGLINTKLTSQTLTDLDVHVEKQYEGVSIFTNKEAGNNMKALCLVIVSIHCVLVCVMLSQPR